MKDLNLQFDSVKVRLVNVPKEAEKLILDEIKDHVVESETKADLVLEFKDKIAFNEKTVNLAFMGGYSKDFFLNDYNYNKLTIPFDKLEEDCRILVEKNFDKTLFFSVLEMLVQYRMLSKNAVFIHASGLEYKGEGIAFVAWKGTGKTRILLEMLKRGAAYIGDDWVILSEEGRLVPYLKAPRLYEAELKDQPSRASFKTRLFVVANRCLNALPSSVSSKIRMISSSSRKMRGLSQKKSIANMPLNGIKKSRGIKLKKIYLLQKTDATTIQIKKVENLNSFIEKIISTTEYETMDLSRYYLMFKFCFPNKKAEIMEQSRSLMKKTLKSALSESEMYAVEIPGNSRLSKIKEELLDVLFN